MFPADTDKRQHQAEFFSGDKDQDSGDTVGEGAAAKRPRLWGKGEEAGGVEKL